MLNNEHDKGARNSNSDRIEIVCKEKKENNETLANERHQMSQHEPEPKQTSDSLKEFHNDLGMIIPKNTITHINDDHLFNNTLSTNNNNILFYNVSFDGVNDWNIVPQPLSVDIDRDASTTIKTVQKTDPAISTTDDDTKTETKDTNPNANRFVSTTNSFNVPLNTKKKCLCSIMNMIKALGTVTVTELK